MDSRSGRHPLATIKPSRLAAGQTIGLLAPASPPKEPEGVRIAMEVIESLGYKVKPAPHLLARNGYLAGDDSVRAEDLNAMFADENVAAVFCERGGYGSSRLLPMLNYPVIQANPKALIGYSDITALHLAIQQKTGLVTFHGPIANQDFTPYTLDAFEKVLVRPEVPVNLAEPPRFEGGPGRVERNNRLRTLYPGKVQGKLVGGNLSLVSHLIGTPFMPDLHGVILFLEDVSEAVYSIDRMLTQLWLAGVFIQVAGVVFGKFTDHRPSEWPQNRLLEDVLSERMRELQIPTLAGVMIGHIEDQATIPLGCMAELDANAGLLTLLEPAVV